MSGQQHDAAVVIVTKNRKADLRRSVRSAVDQTGANVHVMVIDDGSTDVSAEMIGNEFPAVTLRRHEDSCGYIVRRNEAAAMTDAPVIFSIDDDAAFLSPHTVAQTLKEFDSPIIGAVAIPFVDVNTSEQVNQLAPDDRDTYVTDTFIGTAHAVRCDVFLQLNGYRSVLVHQGEESDYCLRMLQAGHVVRLGLADPIHHFESPQRDIVRMSLFGRRNDVLYAWHNVPMPWLLVHLLATTVNGVIFGFRLGKPLLMLRGLGRGYIDCLSRKVRRRPVSCATYRLSRRLKKIQPAPIDTAARQLHRQCAPCAFTGKTMR